MKTSLRILLIGLFTACGSANPELQQEEEPARAAIKLSEEEIAFNKIVIGKLSKGAVFHKVKATGKVDIPPNYTVRFTAPVGGYLSAIKVLPGDRVVKGQVLATLTHPSIAQTQQHYLEAKSMLEFIQSDLARKAELLEGKSVAQREFDQLTSEATALAGQLQSLEQELRRLGIDHVGLRTEIISQRILLGAPISGVVTHLWSQSGEYVDEVSPVMSILNREHEHVELQIFQDDIGKIRKGMMVHLKLPRNHTIYSGEVFLVNTQLDPETLSANIHVHPGENFPELPVNAVVFGEVIHQVDSGYVLPSSELIRSGAERFIFVKTVDGLVKTSLKVGHDDGNKVEILETGLFDQEVVLRGNYYLNGEVE